MRNNHPRLVVEVGLRTLGRRPEERLRSDSVTGPLCPTSSSHLLVRAYGSIRSETGRPSETGPVTQSLHSRTSGPGPRAVRSHPAWQQPWMIVPHAIPDFGKDALVKALLDQG